MKKILFAVISGICLNVVSGEAIIKQELLDQEKNIYKSQKKQIDTKVKFTVSEKQEKTGIEKK